MLHRGIRNLAAGLVIMSAWMGQARADFAVVFQPENSATSAGQFVYSALFNTTLDPGTGQPVESLTSGSFITVYDVRGLTGVTLNSDYAASFSIQVLNVGITPTGTTPVDFDDISNVTLTYTGPTLTSDTAFINLFTVTSTLTGVDPTGYFAGQDTKSAGLSAGSPVSSIGRTTVPTAATPEPASAVMLGLGLAGLAFRLRRKGA